jgi:hypothetical protein
VKQKEAHFTRKDAVLFFFQMTKPHSKFLVTDEQILEELWDEEEEGDLGGYSDLDSDPDPDPGELQQDKVYEVHVQVSNYSYESAYFRGDGFSSYLAKWSYFS